MKYIGCYMLAASVFSFNLQANETKIEEVMVTAQKHAENMQEVPIAMNAYNNDFIVKSGVQDLSDLSLFSPSLDIDSSVYTQPKYYIRGIGTDDFGIGADPAVGVYFDGIYVGRAGSSLMQFNDIERVEVLKGPQGTLFGRNAAAGAINIITNKPSDEIETKIEATFGNYTRHKFQAIVNTPLNVDMAMRSGVLVNKRDGYIENLAGGADLNKEDNWAAFTSLAWRFNDKTDLLLRLEYESLDQDGPPSASTTIGSKDPFGDVANDVDSEQTRDILATTLTLIHDLNGMEFKSLSSWRSFDSKVLESEDGTADIEHSLDTFNGEDNLQFSQEFRIVSVKDNVLTWRAGISYFNEQAEQTSQVHLPLDTLALFSADLAESELGISLPPVSVLDLVLDPDGPYASGQQALGNTLIEEVSVEGDFQSSAIYADITFSLNDVIDLTFGLRYTYGRKVFSSVVEASGVIEIPRPLLDIGEGVYNGFAFPVPVNDTQTADWESFDPRFVINAHFTQDTQGYFSVTEGHKAGGFNSLGQTQLDNDGVLLPPFDQEEVLSIELGLKSEWFEHRLRLNSAIFFFEYDGLQKLQFDEDAVIPFYTTTNGDAQGRGFELDAQWLATADLFFNFSMGLLDTEYTKFVVEGRDLKGEPIGSVPEETFTLSADYRVSVGFGDIALHLDATYNGDHFADLDAAADFEVKAATFINARVAWIDPKEYWTVALWSTNLGDEEQVHSYVESGGSVGSPATRRRDPRFYGLSLEYQF